MERYSLTIIGAAKLLDYNIQYVRRLAKEGRIPALKQGRMWKFDPKELEAHFQKQTKEYVAQTPQNILD